MLLINKAFIIYDEIRRLYFFVAFIQILFVRGGDQLIADSGWAAEIRASALLFCPKVRDLPAPVRGRR
jgi:hypothetical protein